MAYKSKPFLLVCILSLSILSVAFSQIYEKQETREDREDPWKEHQQCQEKCTQQPDQQQLQCQKRCDKKYKEQQRGGRGDHLVGVSQEEKSEAEDENPYFFDSKRFINQMTSPQGNISVLERFTSRSNLLKGIENYRVTLFGAGPNTFMVPNHWDVDTVCVVLKGTGAVTILHENNKETHNIMAGDIFRLQAGATVYSMNTDNEHNLYILELTIPLNTPGRFESFNPLGGRNKESYFSALSDEILQAAFNTESDRVRRLFKTTKGSFVRASREQIRTMTAHMPSEHGVESQYTCHSLGKGPIQSNQYGQLYLTRPADFKQLQDLDVAISYANITGGGMVGPYYNSKSTTIAYVARGNGYFEMACPHLNQQQGSESSASYQKVRSRISRMDVFVIPAGHPVALVAADEDNVHIVGIELNARDNQRNALAGGTNIFKQLEREAMELSFDVPAGEVDEIFNRQRESWFFPAPGKAQEGGRDSP